MKKHEIIFSILKIPLDFIIVIGSFFIAREIRLVTDLIPGVSLPIQTLSWDYLLFFALIWALLYIWLFAIHGLYSIQISHSKVKEFMDVVRYSLYWFLFFSVGVYFGKWILYEGVEIPRLIIFFTFMISCITGILMRIFLNNIQYLLLKNQSIEKRQLVLIHNKIDKKLAELYTDIDDSKIYTILGYINDTDVKKSEQYPYLWGLEALEKVGKENTCDEVLYIDSWFDKQELLHIWEICKTYGIRYRYITNSFDITRSNTTLSLINRTPVVEIKNTPLENWGRVIKRSTDIVWSIIGILITLPIMIIVALWIKIEDPSGPIIYKNRRIWQNGKTFDCYKFRYLKWKYCTKESYENTQEAKKALEYEKKLIAKQNSRTGPLYKIQNDPRKTRIGAFIEKYSIDEIPQFFNVFLGDMSLVWPRPHQPREVQKYEPYQNRLLTIKPWITGMAQVNGREANNFVKESKLDIFYIENWSFLLDIKILLKTFWTILTRK